MFSRIFAFAISRYTPRRWILRCRRLFTTIRDDSGLEADAVIETLDGRWAAFEFKLSEEKVPDAVKSLRRLRKKVAENPRAQGRPPEFLCVITGIGSYAREVEEGIYVVPLRALAD